MDQLFYDSLAQNNIILAKRIVNEGYNVNTKDEEGWTPLMLFVEDEQIVKFLMHHGAKINLKNKKGDTALHIAVGKGRLQPVKDLLKYNPKIKIKNNKGKYPWQVISRRTRGISGKKYLKTIVELNKQNKKRIVRQNDRKGAHIFTKNQQLQLPMDLRGNIFKYLFGKKKKVVVRHTGYKKYTTLDNGGEKFIVYIKGKHVIVYNYNGKKNREYKNVKKIFLGRDSKRTSWINSIAVEISKNKYVFLGDRIRTITTKSPIIKYYSTVGNSGVSYPVALTKDKAIFVLDKKQLLRSGFRKNSAKYWAVDAYDDFYKRN